MNESDVREEFIAPLLRLLGYRSGTEHGIVRELPLRYPRSSLGRKKPNDPELRGRADYVCIAGQRVRWTIEAKPPSAPLTSDDEEQSYSYAVHPEVRAVYHCVTNGHHFRVYLTTNGPTALPLASLTYSDMQKSLDRVKSLLSPLAILTTFPEIEAPVANPIGPGLGAIVRVASGYFVYTSSSPNSPFLDLTYTISEGCLDRDEDGHLSGFVVLRVPFRQLNDFSARFAAHRLELRSTSKTLSTNRDAPTEFLSDRDITLPPLSEWPPVLGQRLTGPPGPVRMQSRDAISAWLEGRTVRGTFQSRANMSLFRTDIKVSGEFEIALA